VSDVVVQRLDLGPSPSPWPTLDPFLFCVHHHDDYPAANDDLGPAASLDGRQLGQDFAGVDGWNMYHGLRVPGFPPHPHRGFETVTYVRQGYIDHADSLGAAARFGRGDVQWLTAGDGIVHSEMFPLFERDGRNPVELFQIWLNLPAEDKTAPAHFAMLWSEDVPRLTVGEPGTAVEVTVIAGALGDLVPPPPPPRSWASRPDSEVAIWHVRVEPGGRWELPAAASGVNRTIYAFAGEGADLGGDLLAAPGGAVVRGDQPVVLGSDGGVELLVLQGRPIGEPVAQYGPFVLNDRAGVAKALEDYQRTGFGGWPWPEEDPVHDRGEGRFARHADGRVERVGEPAG
jgi:hypothetical protein